MCRILKVLVVAPQQMHLDLRRRLSSLEYDIVATVTPEEAPSVNADLAVVWEPDAGTVALLREKGMKVVTVGQDGGDLNIAADELDTFRSRVWELFRAR